MYSIFLPLSLPFHLLISLIFPHFTDIMSTQKLPSELLDKVFQLLSQHDAYQCMLASKSPIAAESYFKEISLSKDNIGILKKSLQQGTINQVLKYGGMVKHLKVSCDSKELKHVQSMKLLAHLDHLNKIFFSKAEDFQFYGESLLNLAQAK